MIQCVASGQTAVDLYFFTQSPVIGHSGHSAGQLDQNGAAGSKPKHLGLSLDNHTAGSKTSRRCERWQTISCLVAQQLAPLHYIVATRRDCCTVRAIVARFAAPRICGTPFLLFSRCLLYFDDKRFGNRATGRSRWDAFWLKWVKNLRFLNSYKEYIFEWQLLSCPIFFVRSDRQKLMIGFKMTNSRQIV